MNSVLSLVALGVLLVVGMGIGLLVLVPWSRGRQLPVGVAATALVGLCALCAVLPNLFLLGVPRSAVLAAAYLAATAGWVLALQRRRVAWPDRRGVTIACLCAVALEAPIVLAATMPPLANDAVAVWWPKVAEVAHGRAPDMHGQSLVHFSQFYPRGLAWLASVASPSSLEDKHLVRAIPVLWTWLTALAMTAVVHAQGLRREALLVGFLFLLLPDVAQCAHAGTPDIAIAAATLVAGLGLSVRSDHRAGYAIATAAACGAASIKEEGNLVLLVVVATFALDVLRRPALRPAAIAGVAATLVLLPFALLRATVPQTRLDTVPLLLAQPDMLWLRAAAAVEEMASALLAPGAPQTGLDPISLPPLWSAWVAVGSLAVLALPARPRAIAVRPALVLLVGALLVYVLSSLYVAWHVRTTLPRLSVEVAPLLLVAATVRWGASRPARNGLDPGAAGTGMSPAGRWSAAHGD